MASIFVNDLSIVFPIYNVSNRSLKNKFFNVVTGGQLASDTSGVVTVQSLRNLNFSVNDGDRIAILGHNGSGKTTLLRVLNGIYSPSSGSVRVRGTVGSLIDISLGIDPEATGLENIYFRGRLLGMSSAEISNKTQEIVEYSDLGEFIDLPVRTYSSGMHMRLGFSISTTMRPDILLMDEWLSVGDDSFKNKAEERMRNVLQTTSIVVIATHSKELVINTCNRAIWLDQGTIRMDGTPIDVCLAYSESF